MAKQIIKEKFNLSGILTGYGKGDRFGDGKVKYTVTVKADNLPEFREKARPWFEDTPEDYRPKWLDEDTPVTLRSGFDFPIGIVDEHTGVQQYIDGQNFCYISDVAEKIGDIKDSKVIVSVVIKSGAVYPSAVKVIDLHVRTLEDFFE